MSKKKTLVALGYYDDEKKKLDMGEPAPGEIPREKPADKPKASRKPEIVEQDLYFCQYCDKFFETLKGKEVHESRWCKEKK